MRKSKVKKDFDFYIDEYMYYCQSRHLRPRTLNSYEQTLRLFERWVRELDGQQMMTIPTTMQTAVVIRDTSRKFSPSPCWGM